MRGSAISYPFWVRWDGTDFNDNEAAAPQYFSDPSHPMGVSRSFMLAIRLEHPPFPNEWYSHLRSPNDGRFATIRERVAVIESPSTGMAFAAASARTA